MFEVSNETVKNGVANVDGVYNDKSFKLEFFHNDDWGKVSGDFNESEQEDIVYNYSIQNYRT